MTTQPVSCEQCLALVINGIPCHETDCPESHIDLRTGAPRQVECSWCGSTCNQSSYDQHSFCDDDCREQYS